MSFSTVIRYGVVSQGGIVVTRPQNCLHVVDDYLYGPADNQFDVAQNTDDEFSVAFWYRSDSHSLSPYWFNYVIGRETSSANRSYQIYPYHNIESIAFLTNDGSTQDALQDTYTEMDVEKWYFIVARASKDTGIKEIKFYDESSYVDGSSNTNYDGMRTNNNFKLTLFASRYGGGAANQSRMNAFGFWNRWIDNDEITQLWNDGKGLSYKHLDSGLKTDLNEWWDMDTYASSKITGNHNSTEMTKYTSGTVEITSI